METIQVDQIRKDYDITILFSLLWEGELLRVFREASVRAVLWSFD